MAEREQDPEIEDVERYERERREAEAFEGRPDESARMARDVQNVIDQASIGH